MGGKCRVGLRFVAMCSGPWYGLFGQSFRVTVHRTIATRLVPFVLFTAGAMCMAIAPEGAMAMAIRHDFAFRVNPANQFRVDGLMYGNAKTSNGPHNFYSSGYSSQGGFGISGSDSDGASSSGACTSSSASSSLAFSTFNAPVPIFLGSVVSNARARAVPGCGFVWASAEANTVMSVREGRANRFGRINWRPRFNTGVGASSWGFARDPVVIDFLDPNTDSSLLPEESRKLLSIGAVNDREVDAGDAACVVPGTNNARSPIVEWSDASLSGYLCDGSFEILADNPYLLNPGTLRLVARDGLIVDRLVDGAFAQLSSKLPSLGDMASFDLPFDSVFTGEIDLDYDFSSIIANPEVDAVFGFDGGGDAFAQVPGPLPLLGVGAVYGFSRKLRSRIKPQI